MTKGAPSASAEELAALAAASPGTDQTGTADAVADTAQVADATADSSTAPGAKPEAPKSMLDAIKSALEPAKSDGEVPPASKDGTTQVADPAKPTGEVEQAAEVPAEFHKHPAWQRILKDRDGLAAKVNELTSSAESYRKVESYMSTHGLAHQEVSDGFHIMALLKNNPPEALKALAPIVERLRAFVGETLPPDLLDEVERGAISEDRAKELSRTRNQSAAAEAGIRARDAARELETTNQAVQQNGEACVNAVLTWEAGVKAKDLDWAIKEPLITARIRELVDTEPTLRPTDPTKAVALTKRAYDDVTAHLQKIRPARLPVRGNTPSGGNSSAAQPKPKNMAEAIAQGLTRGG